VWALVDAWLSSLTDDHFIRVLPLVRRTFAAFAASELRDLSVKAGKKPGAPRPATVGTEADDGLLAGWDPARAALPLPLLRELLGLAPAAASPGEPA
jgi:hypothetical protein